MEQNWKSKSWNVGHTWVIWRSNHIHQYYGVKLWTRANIYTEYWENAASFSPWNKPVNHENDSKAETKEKSISSSNWMIDSWIPQ